MILSDLLPATIAWNPAPGQLVLLGAVEDDLALVETVLAGLPAKTRGQVFVEVEGADRIRLIAAPGRVCVTWLDRGRGQSLESAAAAWLDEMLPVELEREHDVYAWFSGDRAARRLTSA